MRYLLILLFFLHKPLSSKGVTHSYPTEPMCFAAVIAHEARGESDRGKRAVYDVLRTRMKKQQKSCLQIATAHKQFSGFSVKQMYRVDRKMLQDYWKTAKMQPVCKNCEWFHRWDVRTAWQDSVVRVRQIDNHVFYKSKGSV